MTRSTDDLAALRGLDPVDGPGLASTWTTGPTAAALFDALLAEAPTRSPRCRARPAARGAGPASR